MIFDPSLCELGEGPLWHPERGQLFWFDILSKRLLTREGGATRHWQFDEHVSAAGWVDRDRLLIASESALSLFDLVTGTGHALLSLEADNPLTRSNDGRVDPFGGFWIGTMGKRAEPGAGAIYRFYRGELRLLFDDLTIPNAICFAPGGEWAYFADTPRRQVMRVRLDEVGWPASAPEVFVDLRAEGLNPDGAVVDARGDLWIVLWGAGRVACHSGADGRFLHALTFPAPHTTCPAFGGTGLGTLFVTSAREKLDAAALGRHPDSGAVFTVETNKAGQAEHRVVV
jgi:sugar lactone lactonase YvrE